MSDSEPPKAKWDSARVDAIARVPRHEASTTSRGVNTGCAAESPAIVTFGQTELRAILKLYGRMVAQGEWRDYAIDFLRDRAVFSIFRRAAEIPIYRIEKQPALARKQGPYSILTATGLILKRGHDLDRVLRVLDKTLKLVAR
jgi:hypothetical protein